MKAQLRWELSACILSLGWLAIARILDLSQLVISEVSDVMIYYPWLLQCMTTHLFYVHWKVEPLKLSFGNSEEIRGISRKETEKWAEIIQHTDFLLSDRYWC